MLVVIPLIRALSLHCYRMPFPHELHKSDEHVLGCGCVGNGGREGGQMGRRHADAWCVTARVRTKTAGLRQGLGEGTVPISVPCISAFTAPIEAVSRGTEGEALDFHGFCINIITVALTSSLFPPLPPPPRRRWWYMAGCCRELCACSLCGWVWCGGWGACM